MARPSIKSIPIIGAACGMAANHVGCMEGPEVFRQQLDRLNKVCQQKFHWLKTFICEGEAQGLKAMPFVARFCQQLAEEVKQVVAQKQQFVVIGGDHSCAAGTWSGVAAVYRKKGDIGLVWID